jgi:hypothetical protein
MNDLGAEKMPSALLTGPAGLHHMIGVLTLFDLSSIHV